MEDHGDRKISKDEATVKPGRSFRYEDYNTRRVFLRSYPLQWDWSAEPDEKQEQGLLGAAADSLAGANKNRPAYGSDADDRDRGNERRGGGRGWRRQVAVAVVEWGGGGRKMVLLRRAKKRLALYLLGCHHGRPSLPFRSGGSPTAPMLVSR